MKKSIQLKALLFILGIALLTIPTFVFSSHKHEIFVDDDASEDQDGSSSHPYKTIDEALDHADGKTEIHVAKGEYEENIKIKKDVKIFGAGKDKTVIKADDNDEPVVFMKDDTELTDVTVKGGKDGVRIDDHAEASIIDCRIKDSRDDGIHIEHGDVKEAEKVVISESEIKDNKRAGIYSETRRLVIIDNEIVDNKSDGIDVAGGSSAWIAGNYIARNDASGLNLKIDGSNIWTKHNQVRYNHNGLAVYFYGGAGKINLEKSKIVNNDNYGISKFQKFSLAVDNGLWKKYLTIAPDAELWGNAKGLISGITQIN